MRLINEIHRHRSKVIKLAVWLTVIFLYLYINDGNTPVSMDIKPLPPRKFYNVFKLPELMASSNWTNDISSLNDSGPSAQLEYVVPNLVHFIWFGAGRKFLFLYYLSVLSAYKIHKPDVIMFHHDHLPVGSWWERLRVDVPTLKLVELQPPRSIYGQPLYHVYHQGDVAKLELILKHGGIYLDYDVIVVSPMHSLRLYDATLGKERPPKFIAGIIVGRKNAPFIRLWHLSYKRNYNPYIWDYNCAWVPYKLYLKKTELLHVEWYKLTTPDYTERWKLVDTVIDWKPLFVVHLMMHDDPRRWVQPGDIRTINSTFGEVLRYVYYGSPKLLPPGS